MKSVSTIAGLGAGLLVALWWAVTPPFHTPALAPAVAQTRQAQCPGNSRLDGKVCACAPGTVWRGNMCVQIWSGSQNSVRMERLPTEPHADNCVFFARKRVPSLPYNLNTWKGKLGAVNSTTPRPGSVAMIEVGAGKYRDVGHVAIVESVSENTLTIIEGNYLMGSVTRRTATGKDVADAARQLHIAGYYTPHQP